MDRSYSKIGDQDFHLYKDCKYSSHYTILNHEYFEQYNLPYNPNTLAFKDKKLNRRLEKALRVDQGVRNKPSGEFKHNLIMFYIFLNGFIAVFLTFFGLIYGSGDISLKVLRFHICWLVALAALGNVGLVMLLRKKEFLINSKIFFVIFSMVVYVYLIISSQSVQDSLFDTSSKSEGLPCILTLSCYTIFVRLVLFDSYFYFLLMSLFISIFYLSINLSLSSYSIYSTLSEFSILVLFLALSTVDSQLVDIRTKQVFWRISQEAELVKQMTKSNEFDRKFSIISLFQRCKHIKSELKSVASAVMYKDLRVKLKQAILDLDYIQKNIGNNEEEAYEIDKNENIDEEDRQFIAQNYLRRDEVKIRRRQAKSVTIMEIPMKTLEFTFNDYGIAELESILNTLGKNWTFDVWFIHQITGHSVYVIGNYLFQKYRLNEFLKITQDTQKSFFTLLESEYKDNPYHNACHAADVCQSFIYFVLQSNLCKFMNTLDTATCVIAALGHDVRHPGVTNRFIINNREPLALEYNDVSVLENMHCSTIFTILQIPSNNVFQYLQSEDWFYMRKLLIYMILETDMSRHFEICSKFKSKSTNLDWEVLEDRLQILGMGLKCADIGHSAKSTELHEKWTSLVCEEFFLQGDTEKSRSMPISMYCDRENTDISKSQAGFIKNICIPLYEVWCGYLNSEIIQGSCLKQLEKNFSHWNDKFKSRKLSVQHELLPGLPNLKVSSSAQELPDT